MLSPSSSHVAITPKAQENVFVSLSMYTSCCLCILIVVYVLLLSMYSYCCPCILLVVYVFLFFVHVFLLLSMYYCCLCILIVVYVLLLSMYSYCCPCILLVVYVFLDAATLTEGFPCFFLGCKANARV
jgi:hypothetical protein